MLENKFRYDPGKVDNYNNLHLQTKKVLEWIGVDKIGIEIGCHTGHLAEWLQKNGCKTIGIDNSPVALEKAKPYLIQSICGNIEEESAWTRLEDYKYDYITLLHVLEHIANPEKVLKKVTDLLKEDGVLIVGLPNICNARDRFNITFGKFEYTEVGVMDRTHLRFFDQRSARELIENSGLIIEEYYSPWQVNPNREFIDHLPLLCHLRFLFKKEKSVLFSFSKNITDVIMLFKCKMKA